jgi:hypothetical protein
MKRNLKISDNKVYITDDFNSERPTWREVPLDIPEGAEVIGAFTGEINEGRITISVRHFYQQEIIIEQVSEMKHE